MEHVGWTLGHVRRGRQEKQGFGERTSTEIRRNICLIHEVPLSITLHLALSSRWLPKKAQSRKVGSPSLASMLRCIGDECALKQVEDKAADKSTELKVANSLKVSSRSRRR